MVVFLPHSPTDTELNYKLQNASTASSRRVGLKLNLKDWQGEELAVIVLNQVGLADVWFRVTIIDLRHLTRNIIHFRVGRRNVHHWSEAFLDVLLLVCFTPSRLLKVPLRDLRGGTLTSLYSVVLPPCQAESEQSIKCWMEMKWWVNFAQGRYFPILCIMC